MKRLFMVFAVLCALQAAIAGAESFTNNGNGTVSDSDTGLMWQQGEPGLMIWDDALTYCEGLSFGGQADWRLPNITELESLIDIDSDNAFIIVTSYFPNVLMSYYWSSTTSASSTSHAWAVYFVNGSVSYGSKTDDVCYVRCVRAGQ